MMVVGRGIVEKTTVERAFELAREGICQSLTDIRRELAREKFSNVDSHLDGRSLRTQLKALIKETGR